MAKSKKWLSLPLMIISPLTLLPVVVSCTKRERNPDIIDINKIIRDVKNVQINNEGKKVYVSDLSISNIRKYVDGLPSPKYPNGVTTTIIFVERTSVKEGIAKITITYAKKKQKKDVEYIVSGFKKSLENVPSDIENSFNNKINSIQLLSNSETSKVLANQVTTSNVKTYVDGIPESTNDFKVEIISVKPETNTNQNTKLIVTLKLSHPAYSTLVITKNYEVDGFMSQDQKDQNDVQQVIDNVNKSEIKVNNAGKEKIVSELSVENINQFVDGLPTSTNGVNVEIKNVEQADVEQGIATIVVKFSKGSFNKEINYRVEGFKKPGVVIPEDIKNQFNQKVNDIRLSSNSETSKVLANQVTTNNVKTYVDGIPESTNDFKVEIISVKPETNTNQNTKLIVTLKLSHPAYSTLVITKNYEVDGFMSQDQKDQNDVQQVIDNVNKSEIKVNDEGKEKLVEDLSILNIEQYVDGLPKQTNEVKVVIIRIEPTNVEQGIATIVVKFSKGSFNKEINYRVEGFKKPRVVIPEDIKNQFNQKVNAISLSSNSETSKILVNQVTTSNVKTYVNGIPESTSDFKVEILEVKTKNNTNENTTIVIKLKFSNPTYSTLVVTKDYEVDGFMSQNQKDQNDVQQVIDNVNESEIKVNDAGKEKLISEINISNVNQFVDGLPTPTNGVNIEIKNIEQTNLERGIITLVLNFKKGSYNKDIKYKIEGFKKDLSKFKQQILNSTFVSLKGRDNIFQRKDLINNKDFAFGMRAWDGTFAGQKGNSEIWSAFTESIKLMFDNSIAFKFGEENSNINPNPDITKIFFSEGELDTDEQYLKMFGKTLNDLKQESNEFGIIEKVKVKFVFKPIEFIGDYNYVGNHPLFKYQINFNLIFETSTPETIVMENIWKNDVDFIFCNVLPSYVQNGVFIYLPDTANWRNQNSDKNWNKLINGDLIDVKNSSVITNENGIKITLSGKNLPNNIDKYIFKNKAGTLDFKIAQPSNENEMNFIWERGNDKFDNEDELSDITITLKDEDNKIQEIQTLSNKIELKYNVNNGGWYQLEDSQNWMSNIIRKQFIQKAFYKVMNIPTTTKLDDNVRLFSEGKQAKGVWLSNFVTEATNIKNTSNVVFKKNN